jgi:hypothetical protein
MTTIMRRRHGEPAPPRPLTNAELAGATIDRLETERAAHEAWLDRISADPGRSLGREAAIEARSARLVDIERHTEAVVRLNSAIEIRERELDADRGFSARLRRAGLLKAAQEGGDQEFLQQLHEAMVEKQRERDAQAALRALADRRNRPPLPQSRSVAAAVLSSAELYDGLRRRLREAETVNEFGTRITSTSSDPVIDFEDISTLATILFLLSEGDPVVIGKKHAGGSWPQGSDLPPVQGLIGRIRHLAANQWLSLKQSDETGWLVSHGEKSLSIARASGVAV